MKLFYTGTNLQGSRPKKAKTMSPVMGNDVDFVETNTSKSRQQLLLGFIASKLNLHVCLLFNSEEITYNPPDISLMGRMLKMKFHAPDTDHSTYFTGKRKYFTGKRKYFTGKIVNYDGCSGKYRVYFHSDGEIVYMHPDDKDVVFPLEN